MTVAKGLEAEGRVYRVDRFRVPSAARGEFLANMQQTHSLLRSLPGFVSDLLLERDSGAETSIVITMAIWKDSESVEQARARVVDERRKSGFDPLALMARLGVEADIGLYRDLA